ncbi:MAG: hypothetical protein LBS02_18340 [Hungatella sp.]|jgi:hypothetical protein|nr:hypothetical protein [Hungatella sp.]
MDMSQFKKERDGALFSLDKQKILKYCKKYGVPLPSNDIAFRAGAHKSIYHLQSATFEQKEKSKQWLFDNGFSPEIR